MNEFPSPWRITSLATSFDDNYTVAVVDDGTTDGDDDDVDDEHGSHGHLHGRKIIIWQYDNVPEQKCSPLQNKTELPTAAFHRRSTYTYWRVVFIRIRVTCGTIWRESEFRCKLCSRSGNEWICCRSSSSSVGASRWGQSILVIQNVLIVEFGGIWIWMETFSSRSL